MSAHTDPWILCDVCHREQFPEDAGSITDVGIREVRHQARINGWRFHIGVGDVCERCEQGLEPINYAQ